MGKSCTSGKNNNPTDGIEKKPNKKNFKDRWPATQTEYLEDDNKGMHKPHLGIYDTRHFDAPYR